MVCKQVLVRNEELLQTLENFCEESYEVEICGYRIMLSLRRVLFMLYLMADILQILNSLSLFLQKENRK